MTESQIGRWYMVNRDGMATLCTDREDAEKEAADAQRFWPHMGPHRAVQLIEAADVETLRSGYDAARLEIESLRARSVEPAGEYPALPGKQIPSYSDDALLMVRASELRAYVDADRAMRAAQPDLNLNCKSTQKRLATLWGFVPAQPAPQQEAQEPVAWYFKSPARPGEQPLIKKLDWRPHNRNWRPLVELAAVERATAPQPSPAAQGDALDAARWTTEQEHAIRQGHEIAASDGYFEARPQIDSNDRRKVFQAGFERGWDAARAAQEGKK